jgi:glycine cleavage system H protein
LTPDDEVAVIETIKVNISLTSPVTGAVVQVNPMMDATPEVINQDPFGDGWLAVLEATDWETDRLALLDAQAYFNLMIDQAGQEMGK